MALLLSEFATKVARYSPELVLPIGSTVFGGVDDCCENWIVLLPICGLAVGTVRMFRQQKKDRAK